MNPKNQTASMNCPKCALPLESGLRDGANVSHCQKCSGIWVDFIEEKQILAIKPETLTLDEIRRLRKLYTPLFKNEPIHYVPCPVCSSLMTRRNWGSHSGIMVDRCENHGTWYDAGEADKVKDFIKLGGIEYEKIRKSEKALSRLESKLTQEVLRLDQRVDSAYRRARLWSLFS